ncbi:tRNA uridine-5-carboxymethylaminomethyl(34) synthesis GTPase MnmE [Leadbettera azotonutricia]|uniref:tRNA modification GTPase MnmE n=1 Tax=Leadbettera azotonutricia (strain ATCC BAA-888 / DSM 13862 / ZAS-9) TaxID=545695 RepID=F5YFB0_LEAAZ|nr:tRNA uridine-5-carboxymethylaminomethyl(34) synthesis GTPase MnmE [Leadbettera azotonutricia]AEF81876.1 tRNA modification GTPase TrmE [Leadbettera azotonutricia ZAS-9]
MDKPAYGSNDPIAAIATPLGESALALIRTSGGSFAGSTGGNCNTANNDSNSVNLLAKIFSKPKRLKEAAGNTIIHGWILGSQGEKIDEVLVSVYRAPKSYTGEDSADISCHGGIAVVKAIMAALKQAGFREALPGEFTFRAFMNGKLDLTRSESVMELVSAKTGKAREQAIRRLTGALEKELSEIKALLVRVLVGAEIYLDYSEDEFNSPDEEAKGLLPDRPLAEEALARLSRLADSWRRERLYTEGALAVIAGRPNAGKSSLFNFLLKEDRSIVTDIPGTTRDWIEALISIEDIPVRLADTAGLRDIIDRNGQKAAVTDKVELIGIARSQELLSRADIVLYVIDGAAGITEEDREFLRHCDKDGNKPVPLLILWNKADVSDLPHFLPAELPGVPIGISAKTGKGIPELSRAIAGALEKASGSNNSPGDTVSADQNSAGPGTLRQKELIDNALASIREALDLADTTEPLDIIAPLIKNAVDSLGEITGEVSTAELLDLMFSRFCVGK